MKNILFWKKISLFSSYILGGFFIIQIFLKKYFINIIGALAIFAFIILILFIVSEFMILHLKRNQK